MAINLHKPADAEIEISLFGPGTGECIVVHLGNGDWMIVDSCTAPKNRRPIALEYLEQIGVAPGDVKLVVITHFHDDHIRGMSEIITSCVNAKVCISAALTEQESIAFAMAHSPDDAFSDIAKPSTHELAKVLKMLAPGQSGRSYTFVVEDKVLYRGNGLIVHALSPSDRALVQSKLKFDALISEAEVSFRKLANRLTPNLCAVALHICNGVDTVLLGSDLEVSNTPHLGWDAVLLSNTKPTTKASVFKIPHHGSHNGHSDDVVEQMLKSKPISIITTMNTHALPLATDLERIQKYSHSVHVTTQPLVKPPVRSRAVEEQLAMVVKKRRVIANAIGHIQVRMVNGEISVSSNEHAVIAA
ncbi:MBL fold metallo-hydrolase [Pseudomonas juntendi]|uniref:MBL fold metallo-hydrolase n=1 Tax=Pseudomonas juntendi TaxID=2666183 RepID=A0AAJ5S4L1_9PSED|nr:MBL fold metallo-hydrolase [Pseudomonas juntendi]WEA21659.1 MBL fold metallo-hydrolase [Pseudomonas juntendi]